MATFTNITIDDTLNSTLIAFHPIDCDGQGWKTTNGRGFRGNFSTCTDSTDVPSATLNFTGVAVYYRSPYFDGGFMRFRLDDVLSERIDLSTPQGVRFNASATRIVWSQTNLENKAHSLVLLPSESSTLNVDAFIVTQQNNPPSTNATAPPSGNPALGPLASTQGTISPKATKIFGLAVGITVGSIAFIIFLVLMFVAARTRKRLSARFKWSGRQGPPPLSNDRQFSLNSRPHQGAVVTRPYSPSPPPSPQMHDIDLPMKSMNSLPLGSDVSHDVKTWSPPPTSNTSHRNLLVSPAISNSMTIRGSPSPTVIKFEPVRRAA
ncbi:hypothetical protein CVT24_010929 [Panaeolus cyanescens]|uniref:Uncharacterized protein n=1 Tax=Panaeolus cyanescens TaxID=181874 RepID=A0A409WAV8_9AGAR|nr:hypothetical protein CVT24_010929 [Panaeolus cyanescens]